MDIERDQKSINSSVTEMPWLSDAIKILNSKTSPRAILFHGKNGLGKFPMAQRLAQNVLCANRSVGGLACDVCKDCNLMNTKNHPDFVILPSDIGEKANVSVLEVRNLTSFVTKTSHRGQSKVVLILNADKIGHQAGNALLKMLEEIHSTTYFVLIAEKLFEVLPTIRSRCQKINVKPPKPELSLRWLGEKSTQNPENIALSLSMAGFTPLNALDLIKNKEFWGYRGQLITAIKKGESLDALVGIAEKMEPNDLGNILLMLAYDILFCQITGVVKYHLDCQNYCELIGKKKSKIILSSWYDSIVTYLKQSGHSVNNRLALEVLFLDSPILN